MDIITDKCRKIFLSIMNINFGDNFIALSKFQTKNELLVILNKCNSGNILLGKEARQEIAFYALKIFFGSQSKNTFGIGIISEGHGLTPQVLILASKQQIFFGFNQEVVLIDCDNKKIIYEYALNSLFYKFIYLPNLELILILHEIGLVALRENGSKIWEFDKDIVEDYEIINDKINLKFMDSDSIQLSLITGKIID